MTDEHPDSAAEPPRSKLGARLYPELTQLNSSQERHEVFNLAQRCLRKHWPSWIVAGPVTILVVLSLFAIMQWAINKNGVPPLLAQICFYSIIPLYIYGLSTFAFVKPMRRFIRQILKSRGVPICLWCGYSLRGVTQPRCPECGREDTQVD